MTEEIVPVPVHIIATDVQPPLPDMIEGDGFSLVVPDGAGSRVLLPEDPLRVRAVITTNVGLHIGKRNAFGTLRGNVGVTQDSPGPRIDSTALPFVITAQNEIWMATEGAGIVGVWVERRIPRGTA